MPHTLPIAGFVLGLCVGLTSLGGAALMAPFLILVLGVRPVTAVGTDLAYGAITKLIGAAVHWHEETVDFAVVKRLALGSVPGGILASLAVSVLPLRGYPIDIVLRRAIGAVLLIVAALVFAQLAWSDRLRHRGQRSRWLQGGAMTAFGAMAGVAVGLSSIGSGSLITPFLMFAYPLAPARAIGTDLFHAAILVTATAAVHAANGSVDWTLVSGLLAGSLPGVAIGSWLSPRLPMPVLRFGLASVLLTSGLKLI